MRDLILKTGTAGTAGDDADDEGAGRGLTLIQSLQRGLRLVEAVAEQGPMTARTLSKATGLGLPTTYHLLRTLVYEGYLGRLASGLYALGPQFRSTAELERQARIVRVLRETTSQLRDLTNATAVVAELDGRDVLLSHLSLSRKGPAPDLWVGMRLPIHATAVGKAVLGQLDPVRRDELLTAPLARFTARTVADPLLLMREAAGSPMAHSHDQYRYGISCVALPLRGLRSPSALSICFHSGLTPRRRLRLEKALVETVEDLTCLSGPGTV
ncbi:IclR family transcriptional regulator [Actinomadura chibensis]|uniref:Helix-turn-helix domain-containing protein n=1 Tax=Actinomadura chibensis TaxID=392828 RepID=A0A5D0NIP9_9ACTN|nr:IclR family transcriptional regulator C-terminal domain-containing protein [Actinomadura chibensis]TYB44300.1 helix-turn-helix domain-containing protein [Actinomadura chibensis]